MIPLINDYTRNDILLLTKNTSLHANYCFYVMGLSGPAKIIGLFKHFILHIHFHQKLTTAFIVKHNIFDCGFQLKHIKAI